MLVPALEEKVLEPPLIQVNADMQETEKMELEAAEVLGMDMVLEMVILVVEAAVVLSAMEEMVLIILTEKHITQPTLVMAEVAAVQPMTLHQILRPQVETESLLSNGDL